MAGSAGGEGMSTDWTSRTFGVLRVIVVPGVVVALWLSWLGPLTWQLVHAAARAADGGQSAFVAAGWVALICLFIRRAVGRGRRVLSSPRSAAAAVALRWVALEGLPRRARHEAAHAVVAAAMGAQVERVDVFQVGGRGGRCVAEVLDEQPLCEVFWARLVIALAGNVVDIEAGSRDAGAQTDIRDALERAAAIISTGDRPSGYTGPVSSDGLLAAAGGRARRLVEVHRGLVDLVAKRLVAEPGSSLVEQDVPALRALRGQASGWCRR